MDVSRLRQGERIAAIAGVALIVFMTFFDWFGVKVSGLGLGSISVSEGANAWEVFSFIDVILLVTAIVAIGLAVLTATQRTVNLPVAASALTAGLGIVALLLVLYRIVDAPGDVPAGVDITRKIGVFLGLIASAGVAAGGWLSMQDEGTSFTEARDQLSGAISGEREAAPAAPAPPPVQTTPAPSPPAAEPTAEQDPPPPSGP